MPARFWWITTPTHDALRLRVVDDRNKPQRASVSCGESPPAAALHCGSGLVINHPAIAPRCGWGWWITTRDRSALRLGVVDHHPAIAPRCGLGVVDHHP